MQNIFLINNLTKWKKKKKLLRKQHPCLFAFISQKQMFCFIVNVHK